MNIEVDDDVSEAIQLIRPNSWHEFFESLRQSEYQQLRSTPKEDLTSRQARVTILDEVEELFLRINKTPKGQ